MTRVQVQVPATIANLGPGFDSLALALQLHNLLAAELADRGIEIQIEGEGSDRLPIDRHNLIASSAQALADRQGIRLSGLRLTCHNHIPLASGLGSSAAAVVAGLLAADALLDTHLSTAELLGLAGELEGHLDNSAAALLGGLVVVGPGGEHPVFHRIQPAITRLAVVVPTLDLPTQQMRQVLPQQVSLADAAFNIGRTALTVEALRIGDFALLAEATQDRLHQQVRLQHILGFAEAESAARQAGAAAVVLAGAGPGLAAFGDAELEPIAEAMSAAFNGAGIETRKYVLAVDLAGAQALAG